MGVRAAGMGGCTAEASGNVNASDATYFRGMSMGELIKQIEVKRDEDGAWTHPDFPDFEEGENDKIQQWLKDQGLTLHLTFLEYDDPVAADRYFEAGEADFSYWEPTKPDGIGWFLLSIHDTEDGPCAWFVRRAAVSIEKAQARIAELEAQNKALAEALRFYSEPERYRGPRQPSFDGDPYTTPFSPFMQDITRDDGQIARAALAQYEGGKKNG